MDPKNAPGLLIGLVAIVPLPLPLPLPDFFLPWEDFRREEDPPEPEAKEFSNVEVCFPPMRVRRMWIAGMQEQMRPKPPSAFLVGC